MSKTKEIKIPAPSWSEIGWDFEGSGYLPCNRDVAEDAFKKHRDYVLEDAGTPEASSSCVAYAKMSMLPYVKTNLAKEGFEMDEFNDLAPTLFNQYRAYEFGALWLWSKILWVLNKGKGIEDAWCYSHRKIISSVMKKYPKITGFIFTLADLHAPGNKLLDYSKMEDADFDNDHTDEYVNDEKANAFKTWVLKWCADATPKDKMRVKNWFETKKSHKQIFAEIQKVVGNPYKFNARLALFVERLFNQEGLDYFFEKTGFATKEDLFMAYFDKLTQFDEETKKSFIKKYLLG